MMLLGSGAANWTISGASKSNARHAFFPHLTLWFYFTLRQDACFGFCCLPAYSCHFCGAASVLAPQFIIVIVICALLCYECSSHHCWRHDIVHVSFLRRCTVQPLILSSRSKAASRGCPYPAQDKSSVPACILLLLLLLLAP